MVSIHMHSARGRPNQPSGTVRFIIVPQRAFAMEIRHPQQTLLLFTGPVAIGSSMKLRWHLEHPDPETVARLSSALHIDPTVAAVLVNRNITTPETASTFLKPDLDQLPPPDVLYGIEAAATRVGEAVRRGESILVFGDYDVDGVTSVALLHDFLSQAGADVHVHIPHRLRDGYGLQPGHVRNLAARYGCRLIVTADCGASSHDAIREAAEHGIDVVVTDHHQPSPEPLAATAEVNPCRDAPGSPLAQLAGVGVAFYLTIGLRAYLRGMGFWNQRPEPNLRRLLDLVAIGTVADMVPLVGVNRVLVHAGLQLMRQDARPGIEALMAVAAVSRERIASDGIAFHLAPRLNVAGRLEDAGLAFDLLKAADLQTAHQMATRLDALNRQRRDLEGQIMAEAVSRMRGRAESRRALVIAEPDWHEGVLGIVASRLVRLFHRPTVVLSGRDGALRGSARSIPGVNIHKALQRSAGHLTAFGGHPMAAGVQLPAENLEAFAQALDLAVGEIAAPTAFVPSLYLDAELGFDQLTPSFLDDLYTLQPFGSGNPEPLFSARRIRVAERRVVGQHHLSMALIQEEASASSPLRAIHFNADPSEATRDAMDRIAFRARWNYWNSRRSIQLVIAETE